MRGDQEEIRTCDRCRQQFVLVTYRIGGPKVLPVHKHGMIKGANCPGSGKEPDKVTGMPARVVHQPIAV